MDRKNRVARAGGDAGKEGGAVKLLFLAILLAAASKEWLFFSVLTGDTRPGEVWLRPMISPALNFRLLEGKAPAGGSLKCKDVLEHRTTGDHTYQVLLLECEGGVKLELQGVDFAH